MENEFRKFMERCIQAHMAAFRTWPYGIVKEAWVDGDNDLCIRYESHIWWHYKETEDGNIEWW